MELPSEVHFVLFGLFEVLLVVFVDEQRRIDVGRMFFYRE